MKQPTAWAGIHGVVGAALLVWSSTAAGQTSSGSIGAGSRVGGTSGTAGSGTGGASGSGYSLSGGTSGTGLGMGSFSAMGAAGTSTSGGAGFGTFGPTTTAGGATNVPSSSNLFSSYYVNPMSVGKPSTTGSTTGSAITAGTARFGAPLYTTSSTGTGIPGVTGTLSSTPGGGLGGLSGAGTTGRRGPAYTCTLVFPYDPPKPTQLQADLQQVISGSSALASKNIKVKLDGQILVLEGSVSTDRERRLAEGLVRLTPGVRQVRNTLVVKATQATAKPGS
jgi:hypothetical protein